MIFGEKKDSNELKRRLQESYELIKKDRKPVEAPRAKKTDLRKSIADSLGIDPEDLGKTFEMSVVKKEETFEYKLQGALATLSRKYNGQASLLSSKSGTLIGKSNSIERNDAEIISALVHADKNPYFIRHETLERYGISRLKDYCFWTQDIGDEMYLTIEFAPDKGRRIR